MKQHTYFTFSILNTIGGLQQIAEWAGFHHEKLDGSGYPFRRSAEDLSTCARVMAVADIFTALAEPGPYRKPLGRRQVTDTLHGQSRAGLLDAGIVDLLFENYDEIFERMRHKQAITTEAYEQQFLAI